jgi:hypothetical protein
MVSLSDDEMRAVMELAEPVCPYDRGRLLRSVADELPGLVRQIALRHRQRLLSEPAPPPPWMGVGAARAERAAGRQAVFCIQRHARIVQ